MRLRLAGLYQMTPSGYGDVAKALSAALAEEGHTVAEDSISWRDAQISIDDPDANVVVASPALFASQKLVGVQNFGYTMSEASRIPQSDVAACNGMDAILVPSTFSQVALQLSGVTVPVHVVPIPARMERAKPRKRDQYFQFLSIFQWTSRKNPETLLAAFFEEFAPEESVSLVIKTWPYRGLGKWEVPSESVRLLTEKYSNRSRVTVLDTTLPHASLAALYEEASCYVSAHRGEGWGLPLFDAMAMGLPCIATAFGGNLAYMSETNSFLVPCEIVPAQASERGLMEHFEGAHWGEVSVSNLRKVMRYVVNHGNEAKTVGGWASSDVQSFSRKRCVDALVGAISHRRAA